MHVQIHVSLPAEKEAVYGAREETDLHYPSPEESSLSRCD